MINLFSLAFLALTLLSPQPIQAGTTFNLTRIPTEHPSTAIHKILSKPDVGFEGYSLGGGRVNPDVDVGVVHVAVDGNMGDTAGAGASDNPNAVVEVTLDLDSATSKAITYTVDIKVGGVSIPVAADTGSSVLWVASTNCIKCKQAAMTISPITLQDSCSLYYQNYGLGRVEGCLVDAEVDLGGLEMNKYSVLGANLIDENLTREASYLSGMIGFGKDKGNLNGAPTILSALYQNGKIKSPTVGFYLSRDTSGSRLFLGDAESSTYASGTPTVLPYQDNEHGLYQVQMDSLTVGSSQLATGLSVIVDTGSTALIVPSSVAPQIAAALLGTGGDYYVMYGVYILPCKQQPGQTASTTITLGGTPFTVRYEDFIGPEFDNSGWCQAWLSSTSSNLWILGDVFLHNVYSTYNTQTGDVILYPLNK